MHKQQLISWEESLTEISANYVWSTKIRYCQDMDVFQSLQKFTELDNVFELKLAKIFQNESAFAQKHPQFRSRKKPNNSPC